MKPKREERNTASAKSIVLFLLSVTNGEKKNMSNIVIKYCSTNSKTRGYEFMFAFEFRKEFSLSDIHNAITEWYANRIQYQLTKNKMKPEEIAKGEYLSLKSVYNIIQRFKIGTKKYHKESK